ncbi:hypothetical protein [Bacteroides heparinolyticus]|uniref:hypothetical protein n=1 Tax=Prevotella heparinolytica TaxID=28113 RepID=UPI0028E5E53B|nr:hypothetical protein [Bacteroides heparinolyticus]
MGTFDWFRKKSPAETLEKEVKTTYKRVVKNAIRQSNGNLLIAGVLVQSAITSTYESLKTNKDLLLQSELTEIEYNNMMERIFKEILSIYLK